LDYKFKAGETGYYEWLALPFASANATGLIALSMDLISPKCPTCDFVISPSMRQNGGVVFRGHTGNDFRAQRTATISGAFPGNPHVYAFVTTASIGEANGDISSTNLDSRAYAPPFTISPTEANDGHNFVLVDNDLTGSANFLYQQFTP
jgi:hypothetical protein